MARKIFSMVALFVVLAATLLQSTFAATYTVGDSTGWQIPFNNQGFYDKWAENKHFVVGDILVFTFPSGTHNVAGVKKAAYDACTTTDPLFTENNGPARITLNTTGDHYFICAVPGHCNVGQKLKVVVGNGASTAPAPAPAPAVARAPGSSPNTPAGVSAPPPSSASSLVATLSFVFLSIVLVLSCY